MSTSAVFVSTAPADSTLIKRLVADIVERDLPKAVAAARRDQVGEPLDDDMFPTAIWGDKHAKPMTRLPHLFYANGYWCISQQARDVLATCDLGPSRIRPVPIYQRDRKTPIPGSYDCINIAGTKACIVPDASSGLQRNPYAKPAAYNPPWVPADGAVAVTKAAHEGADIWKDPALQQAFFVSGKLGTALIDLPLNFHRRGASRMSRR